MGIHSTDFPGQRLVACFNPVLAEGCRRKHQELLVATERLLETIRAEVGRRTKTPLSAAQIGQKVGKAISASELWSNA